MALEAVLTGNLGGDPEMRYTPRGTAVLEMRVAATLSRKNRDTGKFEDDGDPLWVSVAFFGEEHEWLANLLRKGDRISVSGPLVRRVWSKQDGGSGESLEIRFPRLLGYQRKQDKTGGGVPSGRPAAGGYEPPF